VLGYSSTFWPSGMAFFFFLLLFFFLLILFFFFFFYFILLFDFNFTLILISIISSEFNSEAPEKVKLIRTVIDLWTSES